MEHNNYFSMICFNSPIGGDFMGIMGNVVLPGILLLNKISLFKKKKKHYVTDVFNKTNTTD